MKLESPATIPLLPEEHLPLCSMAQHLRIGMDHCYASLPCMEICSYFFQVAVVTYLSKQ